MGVTGEPAGSHGRTRMLAVCAAAFLLLVLLAPLVARASSPAKGSVAAARETLALNWGGTRAPQGSADISRPTPPPRTRPTIAGGGGAAAPDAASSRPALLGRSSSIVVGSPASASATGSTATRVGRPAPAIATVAGGDAESPANSNRGRPATGPGRSAGTGSDTAASQGSPQPPVVAAADGHLGARLRQPDAPPTPGTQQPIGRGSQSGAAGSLMPNLEILIAQFESIMRARSAPSAPTSAARAAGSTLELQSVLSLLAPPPRVARSDTPRPWQRPHAGGRRPTAASPVTAAVALESARFAPSTHQTLDIRGDTRRVTPQNAPRSPTAAAPQRLLTAPATPAGAASSVGAGAGAAAPSEALLAVFLVCILAALLPARLALDPFPLQSIVLTLRLERPG